MSVAQLFKSRVNPHLLRIFGVAPAPRTRFLMGQRMCLFQALKVDSVIDVGANVGQYGAELRRIGYSGRIYSFEPMSEAFAGLREASMGDPLWSVHNVALGDRNDTLTLHTWSGSAGESSSLRAIAPSLEARLGPAREEIVPVTTLDAWCDRAGLTDIAHSWLKIDTQGYEVLVLGGAAEVLKEVAGVEIELPFQEWYQDMASTGELLEVLRRAGFRPATIMTERFRVEWNGAVDADALFVRV